ncbi:hypothetical protein [Cohnella panacarvi]|uniref:glucuronyl esterase domain-containing protein n=1 Tax=Cohnella panacarvi TaxID=400776 RepID=UPI000479F6C6|nr:hypothetical protein [Cohnella panacarvi]
MPKKQQLIAPSDRPIMPELPDPFVFRDGRKVSTPAMWDKRAEELKELFQHYMYGYAPNRSAERADYEITDTGLLIQVTIRGKAASFPAEVSLPTRDCGFDGPYPVIFSLGAFEPDTANARGYAVVTLRTEAIASDKAARTGAFFELYPYAPKTDTDVGVLLAWGWAAGKTLDALERNAYPEIDSKRAAITGFSRWGKAALVAGALDERFKVVNPHCSGAGGMASFRRSFEGKMYYWGIAERCEPLEALQSESESHWFNSTFGEFKDARSLPFDQHELASLVAPRGLLVTGGYADYWTNPEGMHVSYLGASRVYEFLGADDRIGIAFRPGGHNRTQEDHDNLLDFCDRCFRGFRCGRSFKSSLYDGGY